jgi:hypothetical protein
MTFYGIWDYVTVGRDITRPSGFKNDLQTSYLADVGGPRHEEWVYFSEVLQKKKPQIQGLIDAEGKKREKRY